MSKKIEDLKAEADELGIKYSTNISAVKLQEKIDSHNDTEQSPQDEVDKLKKQAHKLIRVIIVPNDPMKREFQGEIFSVSNAVLGTYKKYVPYNQEEGYHLPKMMIDALKERKYQSFQEIKGKDGNMYTKSILIPAFNIVELEPLSEKELKDLASQQQARNAIQKD